MSGNIFVSSVFSFVGADALRAFQVSHNSKLQNTRKNCEEHFKFSESSHHHRINVAFQYFFYPVTKIFTFITDGSFHHQDPKAQNAVIDQIRAVQIVSSKQASAEKISHEFYKQYVLEYKWLQKMKEI